VPVRSTFNADGHRLGMRNGASRQSSNTLSSPTSCGTDSIGQPYAADERPEVSDIYWLSSNFKATSGHENGKTPDSFRGNLGSNPKQPG
jgi:hypothetical protein